MLKKLVLTTFCKDRPGIVADLSEVIYKNGCHLEDSTMTRLAGKFAVEDSYDDGSGTEDTDPAG